MGVFGNRAAGGGGITYSRSYMSQQIDILCFEAWLNIFFALLSSPLFEAIYVNAAPLLISKASGDFPQ